MRAFRLSDPDLGALAAGRPSAGVLADLRRAQISRHLLLLRAIGTVPAWYDGPAGREELADPMRALHTAATLAGDRPPDLVRSERVLVTSHRGLHLRVRLEDTDPVRARLGLTPVPRLDDAAAEEWQRMLDGAWQILVDRHRDAAGTLAAVLSVIVPVEPDPEAGGISATSADAYGAVAISAPAGPAALAAGLLHETQHSVLNAVRLLFDLVRPGGDLGYSPWRDDPRPAFGVLHGAYAYLAVTRFWRAEPGRLAAFEFARWRQAVAEAADGLLGGEMLTAAGRRFVTGLRDEVAGWLGEPVDPEVARLAAGANADHRARWRLQNLDVSAEAVSSLVTAWRAGLPAPEIAEPPVRAAGRRVLERSDRLRRMHDLLRTGGDQSPSPGSRVRPGPDASPGADSGTLPDSYLSGVDLAFLKGDRDAALTAYLAGLEKAPEDTALWSGIALVTGVRRPELSRALARALPEAEITQLLEWVG